VHTPCIYAAGLRISAGRRIGKGFGCAGHKPYETLGLVGIELVGYKLRATDCLPCWGISRSPADYVT
jgi:hypothetical protein